MTAAPIQTDLFLYVTADESTCGVNVAAYAMPCMYDLDTGRPVLSVFNVCNRTKGYSDAKLLGTITHEITHSLVGGVKAVCGWTATSTRALDTAVALTSFPHP